MIGLLLGLAACSDWLNVSPDDQVNEETLFTDGDGYRNALNGIYKDLADFALYGRELTWGMNEVLGQTYHLNYIPSDHAYYYMTWSMYDNDKVEAILSSLWEQAYNAIANCNNLISHIAHADATLFSGKDMELNMIYGEALALRAFIHLDLLRLFAPAPVVADQKKYIPYMEDYGTLFGDRESVKDCMNKIIRDLKQAKKLLSEVDIIPENRIWSKTYYRIEGGRGVVDDNLPRDIFYMYRGYRMNYWATTAILARAYMYDGQQALAREQAQEVIAQALMDAVLDISGGEGQFAILSATSQSANQNAWIDAMKTIMEGDEKYSKLELVDVVYGDDEPQKSTDQTAALLQNYKDLKVICAPTTVGIAAAAKYLQDNGSACKLTGLGLPSEMLEYTGADDEHSCPYFYLWDMQGLGKLSALTTIALINDEITGAVDETFTAGDLGDYTITAADDGGTEVVLGAPLEFNPDNIEDMAKLY